MVDLQDLEMHQKMVAIFAPEVLEDYTRQSVQALQDNVALLLSERAQITDLVSSALMELSDLFCETPPLPGVKAAVYALIEIKKLTGT